MSLSSISNSLLNELQFTLTSPFVHKEVVINSHTPYDEPKEIQETFNKGNFYSRDFATGAVVEPNQVANVYADLVNLQEPPEINYFQKEYSNEIVEKCLNNGYSAQEAVNVKNAYKAYGINENNYRNGVGIMSTQSCDA